MLLDLFYLFRDMGAYVIYTLWHNALWLFLGILTASMIQVYVNPESLKRGLLKQSKVSIPASVAFGAFTPFCACGTMAIVVSMLTTVLPWGPIMAFLTSSPLMSPDFFIMVSGVLGTGFAVALALSSIAIGLSSGFITNHIEARTTWLTGQGIVHLAPKAISTTEGLFVLEPACCSSASSGGDFTSKGLDDWDSDRGCKKLRSRGNDLRLGELAKTIFSLGVKQVLFYFSVFAAIGYFINHFVPDAWIMSLFGAQNWLAIPLAALLGIPLYVSGASSLPILDTLLQGGASSGALLAFMITGPGTSLGALAGIMTLMKKRAVALYVLYLYFGAVFCGIAYNLWLMIS